MRVLCTLLFVLISVTVFAQTDTPETHFDFWVGNWELSWEHSDGSKGTGTNLIEKTLDGVVIQENFRALTGAFAGMKGTSISVYNPQTQTWRQAWADNQGGYFDFFGITDDGVRIFQTQPQELADGRIFVQRMRFYDIEENSLIWDWESSNDGGENWTLAWRIFYTRLD